MTFPHPHPSLKAFTSLCPFYLFVFLFEGHPVGYSGLIPGSRLQVTLALALCSGDQAVQGQSLDPPLQHAKPTLCPTVSTGPKKSHPPSPSQ